MISLERFLFNVLGVAVAFLPVRATTRIMDANLNPSCATIASWEGATPNLYRCISTYVGHNMFHTCSPNGWVLRVIYYRRRMFEKNISPACTWWLSWWLPPAELSTRTCQGWHDFLLPESAVHAWQKGKLQGGPLSLINGVITRI